MRMMISREEADRYRVRLGRRDNPVIDYKENLHGLMVDMHAAGFSIEKSLEYGYLYAQTISKVIFHKGEIEAPIEAAKLVKQVSEELKWDWTSQMMFAMEMSEG